MSCCALHVSTQNITVGDQVGTPNKLLQVRPLTRAPAPAPASTPPPRSCRQPPAKCRCEQMAGPAKPPIAALKAKLLANAANFYYLASKLAINHRATELGCSKLGTRGHSTLASCSIISCIFSTGLLSYLLIFGFRCQMR